LQIALRHAQRSGTESYHFSTFIIIVARARTRVDTAGAIYEASKYKRGRDALAVPLLARKWHRFYR